MLNTGEFIANQSTCGAGAALFRSHIEIGHILDLLVAQSMTLWAFIGDERLFLTRLIEVDPDGEYIVVSYAPEKLANDALLADGEGTFYTDLKGVSLHFFADAASETVTNGIAAIRLSYPTAVLRGQRREHKRLRVSAEISLRCVADNTGAMPFDAEVSDISLDGMGTLRYEAEVHLLEGTVLKGSKIIHPLGEAIVADLEVMHISTRSAHNGCPSQRADFRFLQRPRGIDNFIALFVLPLEKKA